MSRACPQIDICVRSSTLTRNSTYKDHMFQLVVKTPTLGCEYSDNKHLCAQDDSIPIQACPLLSIIIICITTPKNVKNNKITIKSIMILNISVPPTRLVPEIPLRIYTRVFCFWYIATVCHVYIRLRICATNRHADVFFLCCIC